MNTITIDDRTVWDNAETDEPFVLQVVDGEPTGNLGLPGKSWELTGYAEHKAPSNLIALAKPCRCRCHDPEFQGWLASHATPKGCPQCIDGRQRVDVQVACYHRVETCRDPSRPNCAWRTDGTATGLITLGSVVVEAVVPVYGSKTTGGACPGPPNLGHPRHVCVGEWPDWPGELRALYVTHMHDIARPVTLPDHARPGMYAVVARKVEAWGCS